MGKGTRFLLLSPFSIRGSVSAIFKVKCWPECFFRIQGKNVRESCTKVRLHKAQERQRTAPFLDSISFHPKAQTVLRTPPHPPPHTTFLPSVRFPPPPRDTIAFKTGNRLGFHTSGRNLRAKWVEPAVALAEFQAQWEGSGGANSTPRPWH